MIKLKFLKKLVSIFANFSLLLNSFLPILLTTQPVYAQNPPLSSNIEYSQLTNEFDISVNTDKELSYQLIYKTDSQIESVVADNVSDSPLFSRQIFAGTCSTLGTCIPHSIKQGLFKVIVPDENWIYTHSFEFNNGTFEIIEEGVSSQFNLTDEENEFLENGKTEETTPTPTETPQDSIQEEPVIETTPTPTETETPQVLGTINPEGNIETTIIPNNVSRNDLLNPTLFTDKDDYAPIEIVLITGSEFTPNTEYFLVITSNNLNEIFRIFTDENGEFTYSYQLDGIYRPDYKVEIKDITNTVIAMITFTDSLPSPQQTITGSCIEDAVGSKLQCTANDVSITNVSNIIILDDGCVSPDDTVTFSANWNVQSGANKRYDVGLYFAIEGQSTARKGSCSVTTLANYPYPPWFNFDDDGCGDIDQNELLQPAIILTVPCSDPDGDNNLNLPYCTSWDNNTNGVCDGPLDALPGTGSKCNCNSGFQIGITVPYFAQIEVVKDLNPTIDSGRFNLQVDSVNQKENAGDDDSTGKVVVSAGSSNNPGGEIHTVSEIAYIGTDLNDYDSSISCVDRGQTTFGGGPDAFTVTGTSVGVLVHKDEDIVCTITNNRINNASLTFIKDALPNDSQDFYFTTTGSGLSSFYLDDDDLDPTLLNTQVFNDLAAGKYSISETAVPGWNQSSAICSDGSLISDIDISSGENVICTFTNTKDATLTINKVVNNSNGGDAVISNFQGKIDSQNVPWGISQVVSIGVTHQASETNLTGYIASTWSGDCNPNGTITLLPGENKTCTVTNNDVAPSLTVVKTIKDDNNGNASINDFSIKINDTNLVFISGTTPNTFVSKPTIISNTEYTLSEKDLSGYDEGDWVCTDDNNQQSISNPFILNEGQSVTCIITNDDKAPKLTLDKIVKNDSGGSAKESDWTLTANGASAGILSGPGATGNTDVISGLSFKAGEYILSESTGPSGYSKSSWTCVKNGSDPFTPSNSTIKLDSGDIITCTITNDDIAPKLTLVKTVVNDNGGDKVISDFNLYIDNVSATSSASYDVLANQEITASEDSLTGYSASDWGGDCAKDGTITLLPGDNKTCTITNDDQTSKLTLVKKVINDNGGTASETDWILRAGIVGSPSGFNGTSPKSGQVIANTEYSLIEDSGPSGYSASQWKCDGGNQSGDKIIFQPGDDVTCTITNDDIQPTLIVDKIVVGSTEPISNFSLFIDTTQVYDGQSNGFNLGTYTVSETPNTDYNTTINGDCNSKGEVTLDTLDSSKTCTITNTKLASIQGRKYNDVNGNGDFDSSEKNNTNRLNAWTINLFDSQWNLVKSMITGDDTTPANNVDKGQYKFVNLLPGQYFICEENQTGWDQTEPSSQNGKLYKGLYCHSVTLNPGQDITGIQFGNFKLGSISGQKFNDLNGNGQKDSGELGLSGWIITLDKDGDSSIENSITTDSLGNYQFSGLEAGTYQIREINKSSWTQTTTNPANINIQSSSQISEIDFGNVQLSDIHGYKWNDENANGSQDRGELRLSGWKIFIDENDNQQHDSGELSTLTSSDLNELGWYWFKDVLPGKYTICEELKSGWSQTFPFPICHNIVLPYDSELKFTENAVFAPEYNFGNQLITPTATIAKSNNTGGATLSPNDSVQYKIKLNILDNDVINFKVTDLLSNGFKYRGGSYQVLINGIDQTSSIPEPIYNSPGVWKIGSLNAGDKLELIYTADISTDQQSGEYTDLAWANGQAAYECKTILATAQPEGYVDTNFVGTEVPVSVSNEDSISAEVEQEEIIAGEVLGASTELPGTGSSTIWLFISTFLALLGLTLLKSGKITTKMSKKPFLIFLLSLVTFAFIVSPVQAQSADLFVRLEEPESPTREKDIDLVFVALDIQDRPMIIKCYKKDPDDLSFSQFGSDIALINGGDSSSCDLSTVISDEGLYQFKVTALVSGASADSQIVDIDYNTSNPWTPVDYRKEEINSCDFKIHFKTANDGQTVKVEIYRSTDSAFSVNNQSLVHSVNIGPDQEADINNSVPDCSQTYYYAIRAFDSAGNGSGVIGDTVHITIIEEGITIEGTTTTSQTSGAILVESSNLPSEEDIKESSEEVNEEDQGQVLGTENIDKKSFFSQHKIISTIIIIGLLIIIVYVFKKINKGKFKKNNKRR